MTLDETLLRKLSEWHPPAGRRTLTVSDEAAGWSVAITADRCDVLGCLVWEAAVRRTGPAPRGEALQNWADRAAARVTGLLEPLKVHEIDAERNEALLRSAGPTQRAGNVFYYEVLLRGTAEAVIRRFQASHNGGKREQVQFALTHEALAKLVADLTAAR
jgi:hypothetical protein